MNETTPIHIISLGAGVQSSTMALMAAAGEITPMPVAAIFADTQAEPASVYRWLDWLEKELPFPVYRVTAGDLTKDQLRLRTSHKTGNHYAKTLIPAYVLKANGTRGMFGRKCTAEYKVRQILKKARELGHIRKSQKTIGVIQWIGISLDEAHRMKPSKEAWAENIWPLVDRKITRSACLAWMKKKGFPEPPRSACVYCPFHSDEEWLRLKHKEPLEFERAVWFDKAFRDICNQQTGTAKGGEVYLHESLVPLDQVKFDERPSHIQISLFGNECEGMCGV